MAGAGRVSHLARLAAVGLGLALGALQQRRRQRLAARAVATHERAAGGGLGRKVDGCLFGRRFRWRRTLQRRFQKGRNDECLHEQSLVGPNENGSLPRESTPSKDQK